MAATFDPALTDALDRLRFRLGDTDTTNALLPDETITALLTLHSDDEDLAALALARGLIQRYAQEPTSVSVDGMSVSWGERVESWRALVADLVLVTGTQPGLRIRRLSRPTLIAGLDEYGRP